MDRLRVGILLYFASAPRADILVIPGGFGMRG